MSRISIAMMTTLMRKIRIVGVIGIIVKGMAMVMAMILSTMRRVVGVVFIVIIF
jgi:hypothetical protein